MKKVPPNSTEECRGNSVGKSLVKREWDRWRPEQPGWEVSGEKAHAPKGQS